MVGRFVLVLLGLNALGLHAQLPAPKLPPKIQVLPLPHFISSFELEGRQLCAFHYNPQDLRPFLYPLRASHAASLTRMGHPHDPLTHSHHNSVWVSHNSVNGLDFWGDHAKNQGRILTPGIPREAYQEGDETASMRSLHHWVRDSDGELQMIEERHTQILPLQGSSSWLLILDLKFSAPKDRPVKFGATGFGPVAVRMARSIGVHDGGGRILNSEGALNEKAVFRKPARWCDYSGRIGRGEKDFGGITLMNHPQNPRNPTAFHVRDDGWMGCCLDLDADHEIPANGSLHLRYALWVHDGMADQDSCEQHWQRFCALRENPGP